MLSVLRGNSHTPLGSNLTPRGTFPADPLRIPPQDPSEPPGPNQAQAQGALGGAEEPKTRGTPSTGISPAASLAAGRSLASPWLHTGRAALSSEHHSRILSSIPEVLSSIPGVFQTTPVPHSSARDFFLAVTASRPLSQEGKAEHCPISLITVPRKAQALDTSATTAIK